MKQIYSMKANSHILNLLGRELIGNDGLAIFELVKNSYDADAENVWITFKNLNTKNQQIIIEDDGEGMSQKTIQNKWLIIGTDSKRGKNKKISNRFGRISLGEKGVGRLAVHRLAKKISLETKVINEEFTNNIELDWTELISSGEYIEDLKVEIVKKETSTLRNSKKGTKIVLSELYKDKWSKAFLRELVRRIEGIKNPFSKISNFEVSIDAGDYNEWIKDVKSSVDMLKGSLYQFQFTLFQSSSSLEDFATIEWEYLFNPSNILKLDKKKVSRTGDYFIIDELFKHLDKDYKRFLRNKDLDGIGRIKGQFYVFNLSSDILNKTFGGQIMAVRNYVGANCGIRVYRDNIRVYNYGEPTDDWLQLDSMKIQRRGDHFGKKVTIGAIELDLSESGEGLIEKTNREGFTENETFNCFQMVCSKIFSFFEDVSLDDKREVDAYLKNIKPVKKIGFSDTIGELKEKIEKLNLNNELLPLVKRVEKDYSEMRDLMLNSGSTGLSLGIVFHELERELRFIESEFSSDKIEINEVKGRIKNLCMIIDTISPLLKKNTSTKNRVSNVVEKVIKIHKNRFSYHEIIISTPVLSNESKDFDIKGPIDLILTMMSNIIDNAIYWVCSKRDLEGALYKPAICVTTDIVTFDGPAIIIVDNGNGFSQKFEDMVQPYKTLKPGGMGLGLYYSDMVMNMMGGKLLLFDSSELEIPSVYNGACIVMVFPKID